VLPLTGCLVGFLVGATGMGGTDVFHAAILLTVTGAAHAQAGAGELVVGGGAADGSIPGVALGSWMSPRIPARALRAGLASVLLLTGLTLV
jgi:uncharacterized membrane protein YfcA